jgi:undecaprenyl-diphosphatase
MLIFSTIAILFVCSAQNNWNYSFIFVICGGVVTYLFRCAFPFRYVGAFIVALLVNTAGYYFWNAYGTSLTAFFIHLYQIICKPLLDRGLIK